MSTAEILLAITAVVFAILSQHYKGQRDDLAAWVVHNNPELFDETADESTGSSGNRRS